MYMNIVQKISATTVLSISGLAVHYHLAHAQMINNIICLNENAPWGKIPTDTKIVISGDCKDISQIEGLNKALDTLMEENSQYKNIYIIILWRELKKNHKMNMDSSPFTNIYYIKVDFIEKNGMSSITKEYIYSSKNGILIEKWLNI